MKDSFNSRKQCCMTVTCWSLWKWMFLLVMITLRNNSEGLSHPTVELSNNLCKNLPQQVASRKAANLLRDYYGQKNENSKNHDELFLITSDASSHGANRHIGLSSFIRQISPSGFSGNDKVWVQYKRQQKI